MKHAPLFKTVFVCALLSMAVVLSCTDHTDPEPTTNCALVSGAPRLFPCEGGDQRFTGVIVLIVFLIAGMGFLGMVTYTTEKRVKEVGIRKVMGASVPQIMALLGVNFVKLILIASVIALPLGYLLGGLFLQIFTYHVSLGPVVFLRCLTSLLVIGLFTIGAQSYRAATSNPADTLRSE